MQLEYVGWIFLEHKQRIFEHLIGESEIMLVRIRSLSNEKGLKRSVLWRRFL